MAECPRPSTERVPIDLAPELREALEAAARDAGVSVYEYLRDAAVDASAGGGDTPLAHLAAAARSALGDAGSDALARIAAAPGRSNVEYVALLLQTLASGGVNRLAEVVPHDVEWGPLADRDAPVPVATMFERRGDHVLVHAEREAPGAGAEPFCLAFRFDGSRLLEVGAYGDVRAALADLATPPPASEQAA